ncbi:MAG: carboxypeptidase M32 [Actinobacteria bacterium]|nr:carboxypeptidase M32 [Actinomycetota bacterium]
MNEKYAELRTRLAEVEDLRRAAHLLEWDQETMMPPLGVSSRAEQLASLGRIAHERFTASEIGRLLDELASFEGEMAYDSDEASLIRVVRRDYEKARKVPPELHGERARAASIAQPVWAEARKRSDFSLFLPYLQKNIDLTHRYVECMDDGRDIYDVLLDDYEQDLTTVEVNAVFDELKRELPPLIEAAAASNGEEDAFMRGPFSPDAQHEFSLQVIRGFGFDPEGWRLDRSVHPFASSAGPNDIRLTSRYAEDDLHSLFSAMHECGHGLYENGVDLALDRTPLCEGVSYAFHESQSRMWENLVGRSRPFWRHFYPRLQQAFPALAQVDEEAFYRAVNRVQPSLIRVDADEVTYNLHVILRFELEQEMLTGKLALADVPEAWDARMKEYLGIDVPDARRGALQDVHWSGGSFGYFSTYSLGNVVSVQLWEKVREAMPDLDDQIEAGEFRELREWLRENVHRHGRKFAPKELLDRIVGGPIDPGPYLRYLKDKLSDTAGVGAVA